jgi:hypothetical protein
MHWLQALAQFAGQKLTEKCGSEREEQKNE